MIDELAVTSLSQVLAQNYIISVAQDILKSALIGTVAYVISDVVHTYLKDKDKKDAKK